MKQSKKAIQDGQAIRKKITGRVKRPGFAMTPDEVVSTIKKHIRQVFGDEVENKYSEVYATRGFFHIRVGPPPRLSGTLGRGAFIRDVFWRDQLKRGLNVRRYQIGLVLRALHGEILTDG